MVNVVDVESEVCVAVALKFDSVPLLKPTLTLADSTQP